MRKNESKKPRGGNDFNGDNERAVWDKLIWGGFLGLVPDTGRDVLPESISSIRTQRDSMSFIGMTMRDCSCATPSFAYRLGQKEIAYGTKQKRLHHSRIPDEVRDA